MIIDHSPRLSGKTTRIIKWIENHPERIMIVRYVQERTRLQYKYPELKRQILDWETFRTSPQPEAQEYAIDNLEFFFREFFRGRGQVRIITVTKEEWQPPNLISREYMERLNSLPEEDRKTLLYGDWDGPNNIR